MRLLLKIAPLASGGCARSRRPIAATIIATDCTRRRFISSTTFSEVMPDEYGDTSSSSGSIPKTDKSANIFTNKLSGLFDNFYEYPHEFQLDSGQKLLKPRVCYNSFGSLNESRDNVIVVCHALTGHSRLDLWWGKLLGSAEASEERELSPPFDTDKFFIICCNVLGSCYGSTGPLSIDESTGKPYLASFPEVTIRDSVKIHMNLLKDVFNIDRVRCVVGGSMGGMQALEWTLLSNVKNDDDSDSGRKKRTIYSCVPKISVSSAIVIATGACHDGWQIGFSECQRQAIYKDPKWNDGAIDPADPPVSGLQVARQIAMMSYRSRMSYDKKFSRARVEPYSKNKLNSNATYSPPPLSSSPSSYFDKDFVFNSKNSEFLVTAYLKYQGLKFIERFDALSYKVLTEKMDSHDLSVHDDLKKERNDHSLSLMVALGSIHQPVLVMGIDSDVLYPLYQQEFLHKNIQNSDLKIIESIHGHDGFLLEQESIARHSSDFFRKHNF